MFPLMKLKNSGFFWRAYSTPIELRIATKVLKDLYMVTMNCSEDSAVFLSVGTEPESLDCQ